jgi:hypothetical protein
VDVASAATAGAALVGLESGRAQLCGRSRERAIQDSPNPAESPGHWCFGGQSQEHDALE